MYFSVFNYTIKITIIIKNIQQNNAANFKSNEIEKNTETCRTLNCSQLSLLTNLLETITSFYEFLCTLSLLCPMGIFGNGYYVLRIISCSMGFSFCTENHGCGKHAILSICCNINKIFIFDEHFFVRTIDHWIDKKIFIKNIGTGVNKKILVFCI